jgi:2-phosphosulfolactate phosphatase
MRNWSRSCPPLQGFIRAGAWTRLPEHSGSPFPGQGPVGDVTRDVRSRRSRMRIVISNLLSGAARATGTAVVIDVFRACATACHAMQPARLGLSGLERRGRPGLKRAHPNSSHGERIASNPRGSISATLDDIRDATWRQDHGPRHQAGTRGILAAMDSADEFWPCLLSSCGNGRLPFGRMTAMVTLAAMGGTGRHRPEDKLCAMYLKNELEACPTAWWPSGFLALHPERRDFFGETAIVLKPIMICAGPGRLRFRLRALRGPRSLRNSSRWFRGRAGCDG